jgi:hypothetical protein
VPLETILWSEGMQIPTTTEYLFQEWVTGEISPRLKTVVRGCMPRTQRKRTESLGDITVQRQAPKNDLD